MKRLLHIGLLLMALLGLIGQSTAMAMAPSGAPSTSMQASMADMDCMGMANPPESGKPPCKKVMLQCIAAMNCSPLVFTAPTAPAADMLPAVQDKAAPMLAARLHGRSFGPEPDPPTILI